VASFPKWMKVLAAAVGALLVLYGLAWIPWGGSAARPIVPSDPVKIRLEAPHSSVTLEKTGEAWRLTAPVAGPADEESVRRLTAGFKALLLESEATRRPESYVQYELAEGKSVKASIWAEGQSEPLVLTLGKNAGFSGRAYLRVGTGPAVYLATGLSRDAADLPLVRWRDRRIIDRRDIERVRVTRGKESFTLQRSSDGWTLSGAPADTGKAISFVSAVRTLAADDLVDPPASGDLKKYGLDAPSASFEVSFSSGTPARFFVGQGDPRPVRKEGVETLYLVPAYRADELDKADFTPVLPPSPRR
jgi:hypothetical protein